MIKYCTATVNAAYALLLYSYISVHRVFMRVPLIGVCSPTLGYMEPCGHDDPGCGCNIRDGLRC